jgi:DNA-binding NtrC family response regulator
LAPPPDGRTQGKPAPDFRFVQPRAAPMKNKNRMATEIEKSVLVIEDDTGVAAYIREVVETFFPVTVLQAASAELARELFCRHRESMSVIISDLSLPGVSGVSLVKELVENHPHIGVLFVTGNLENRRNLSKAVGREVSLVMKPFGPIELKVVLENFLEVGATAYEPAV